MREAGGPLATIAARYGAALRSTSADWSALRTELHREAAILTQEVLAEETIQNFTQEAHDVEGARASAPASAQHHRRQPDRYQRP
jgi:multidrug resistance efflux pump